MSYENTINFHIKFLTVANAEGYEIHSKSIKTFFPTRSVRENVWEMDAADSIKISDTNENCQYVTLWTEKSRQHNTNQNEYEMGINKKIKKNLKTRYKKQLNFCKQFHIKMVKMSYLIVVLGP